MDRSCAIVALGFILFGCGGMTACGGSNATEPSGGGTVPSTPALSYLALFPTQRVAIVGEGIVPKVTARDLAGADVPNVVPQYSSGNTGVVRVEPDGRLSVIGAGTATVRASAGGRTAEITIHAGLDSYNFGALGPPRILDANYIDLSKIERISRFRSTVGHSYGNEPCRSMKHYFQPRLSVDWTTVDVYAPASGSIFVIARDGSAGSRVLLRPRDQPALVVTLFHVNLDPGIVVDSWVNAGDRVGRHAASTTMSDIAMSFGTYETGTHLSFFEAMTDAVFAQYQARGVPSREAAIITRAERDADPVPCSGEGQFTVPGRLPDWLVLN